LQKEPASRHHGAPDPAVRHGLHRSAQLIGARVQLLHPQIYFLDEKIFSFSCF
jgi:hypothetical protein